MFHLIQILPIVLGHESEGTKVSSDEGIKTSVSETMKMRRVESYLIFVLPIIWIRTKPVSTREACWTLARSTRVPAHPEVVVRVQPPVALIVHEVVPGLVRQVAPQGQLFRVLRIVSDTLLWQHAHVDLEPEESEDCEREHSENDHISEILDRVHDSTDDGLQSWNHSHGF